MLKILTLIIFFYMFSNFTHANIFKPYIVNSDDQNICNLILNHYSDLYKSNNTETNGIIVSKDIFIPKFTAIDSKDSQVEIKSAEVDFYGENKLFVHHNKLYNWRGVGSIYTRYLINPSQIKKLEGQLKADEDTKNFHPMGSLDYSWQKNNVLFQYKSKWYVLEDFGDFYRNNSLRYAYRIMKNGNSKKVCTIKIFQNFEKNKTLPFVETYKKSVEKIMLSSGGCSPYSPGYYAKEYGRTFLSMAIFRPWAVNPSWSEMGHPSTENIIKFQKKHFSDWKFQDIWSYREHEVHKNIMYDAITELKNFYIANYYYSESDAVNLASNVIKAIPGRYYSLGIYHNEKNDFTFLQKIVDGTYKNWDGFHRDLKLKFGSIPLVALSLTIDNPRQYKKLPLYSYSDSIKSFYDKDLLMYAAHMNNYDTVKYLIDLEWPVSNVTKYDKQNSCDPTFNRTNRSALTYAAENASIQLIKLLVDAGADTNIKDSQGNNLDYYMGLNPRFTEDEKNSGFNELLKKFSTINKASPSFSCNQKLNRIEEAICNSEGLSIYDSELSKNYKLTRASGNISSVLKGSQIKWLKRRNTECGKAVDVYSLNSCLARTTRARIRYLEYIKLAFKKTNAKPTNVK